MFENCGVFELWMERMIHDFNESVIMENEQWVVGEFIFSAPLFVCLSVCLSVGLSPLLVFRRLTDWVDLWLDRKLIVQGS